MLKYIIIFTVFIFYNILNEEEVQMDITITDHAINHGYSHRIQLEENVLIDIMVYLLENEYIRSKKRRGRYKVVFKNMCQLVFLRLHQEIMLITIYGSNKKLKKMNEYYLNNKQYPSYEWYDA